jgi:hypothetical protein
MLDIFQSNLGERTSANSLPNQRNVALPPPANRLPPVRWCGFARKFHTKGHRDLVGDSAQRSQSCDMGHIDKK